MSRQRRTEQGEIVSLQRTSRSRQRCVVAHDRAGRARQACPHDWDVRTTEELCCDREFSITREYACVATKFGLGWGFYVVT